MNRLLVISLIWLLAALQGYAQGSSANFNSWSHVTSAVDAKGIRHDAHAYKGSPPWLLDCVPGIGADYPVEERRMRHEGRAIVRLTLDINTGRVVKTTLLESSGYRTLDNCAIASYRTWRWRPGKWKEIDMPVRFRIGDASAPPPHGSVRLPHS